MSYREVFFTAVMVSGLAALLFGPAAHIQPPLEAEVPVVETVSAAPSSEATISLGIAGSLSRRSDPRRLRA